MSSGRWRARRARLGPRSGPRARSTTRTAGERLVIKGKSDSAPKHALSSSAATRYFGAEVGGTMYWVKESDRRATGADRFLPGPSGTSPDRLLKDLIKASKKVDKLDSEEIRGVTTTHYRAHLDGTKLGLKGNADGAGRRRLDRRAGTSATSSRPLRPRQRSRRCLRPLRLRCTGRRRGAACERDRLREEVREAHGARNAPTPASTSRTRIRCVGCSLPQSPSPTAPTAFSSRQLKRFRRQRGNDRSSRHKHLGRADDGRRDQDLARRRGRRARPRHLRARGARVGLPPRRARHHQGPPRRNARVPQELPDDDLRLLRDAHGRPRGPRLQGADEADRRERATSR